MTNHRSLVTIEDDQALNAELTRSGRSASWHLARLEELRLEFLRSRGAEQPGSRRTHASDTDGS